MKNYVKKYENAEIKINNQMSLIAYPNKLGLYEKKFIYAILAKTTAEVHQNKINNIKEPVREIMMNKKQLQSFLQLDNKTFNKKYSPKNLIGMSEMDIEDTTAWKMIHGFAIYLKTPTKTGQGVIFDAVMYDSENEVIYVSLGKLGVELFNNIDNKYYYFKLVEILKLQNSNAQRLYELLIQFRDVRRRTIKMDEYKFAMGWKNETRTDNIMRATEKAMAELVKYQMFPDLQYYVVRDSNRRIKSITFTWRKIEEITSDKEPIQAKPKLSNQTIQNELESLKNELDELDFKNWYRTIQRWFETGVVLDKRILFNIKCWVSEVKSYLTDEEILSEIEMPSDANSLNDLQPRLITRLLTESLLNTRQLEEATAKGWFDWTPPVDKDGNLLVWEEE